MLEKVKLFLRIEPEFTEEDSLLLSFIDEAKAYCRNAVGFYPDEDNPLYKRFVIMYVTDAYENRSADIKNPSNVSKYTYLLMQLRYCNDNESGQKT